MSFELSEAMDDVRQSLSHLWVTIENVDTSDPALESYWGELCEVADELSLMSTTIRRTLSVADLPAVAALREFTEAIEAEQGSW